LKLFKVLQFVSDSYIIFSRVYFLPDTSDTVQDLFKHTDTYIAPKEDAAAEIIRGAMTRESNVYFPSFWYIANIVNAIAPDFTAKVAPNPFRKPEHSVKMF